jgi:hypothetical protein
MALLSATALVYTHGLEAHVWNEIWGIARPADTVWGSALGTGLGAWLGAIPIPLDWLVPRCCANTRTDVVTYTLNLGTAHGKPFPSPSLLEHTSVMRWDH